MPALACTAAPSCVLMAHSSIDIQKLDIDDLEAVKTALDAWVADPRWAKESRVHLEVRQIAEICRVLVVKVQYLEAMVKEMRDTG